MARTLIASDDFNRTTGPGANWANLNPDWGGLTLATATKLFSAFQTPNPVRAAIYMWVGAGTFTANQASSITIQGLATEGGTNLNWGASVLNSADINGGQDRYEAKVFDDDLSAPGGRTTTLYKVVDGVATSLHSADVSWGNGDTLDLEHEDGVLRVCKNGTPLGGAFTHDDSGSSPLTSGAPGLTQAGGGTAAGHIFSWAGYNITAPAAPIITGPSGAAGAASLSVSAAENQGTVGTWTATNSESWSLTGADAALLAISVGGVVTKLSGNFDFEAQSSYSFNVVNGSASQAVTLTITNVVELTSPLSLNVGATTATLRFSSDVLTGTAYFLRRTGLTPADAATIISTGESQAMAGSNPQSRDMAAFTAGLTYYVDMARSGSTDVVSAGPFYPGTGRPVSDVSAAGYTSTGASLFGALDEDAPGSNADYITSPTLTASFVGGPIMGLDKPYTAGTYSGIKATKWVTGGIAGEFRINFLDGSNALVGQTAVQAMNDTPTTYTLSATLTGTATRWQVEERSV